MTAHLRQVKPWPQVLIALAVGLALIAAAPFGRAQETDADRALTAATRLFQGGWYDQAEKELKAYLTAYPGATNRNYAVLLQAQSRFQLKDFEGVIQLIETNLKSSAPDTDQFLYWKAQAQSQVGQFEAAAGTYGELLKTYPNSRLSLEASYGEAAARYRLGDTARTVELLQEPESAFQRASRGSTNETVLLRGKFLLAEALFAQKHLQSAEKTLTELALRQLGPDAEWQRQFLLARVEFADRRGEAAFTRVTNLIAVAASRSNVVLQARSLSLKGEILEERQPEAAAGAYEEINRIAGVSPEQKRQAALKLVDLAVSQNRFSSAVTQLTQWLDQNPQEPASDLIRLTLGEIHLKQLAALAANPNPTNAVADFAASTNFLSSARSQFDYLIEQMTNSPLVGNAYLDRGWCFWEEARLRNDSAKLLDCQRALQAAIAKLPKSLEQAQARFKLGDCWFRQGEYTNALTEYQLLVDQYADHQEAREKILDQALLQIVRANLEVGHLTNAQTALDLLLTDYPASRWGDQALFLCAQAAADAGQFAQAQEAFADFQRRFAQSRLLPDVRLAIARLHSKQADWTMAIRRYDEWLTQFTNQVSLRPQAQFERAWCYYQAGNDTNAYMLITNLVRDFPNSETIPVAHLWLGDYYLNRRDYATAEKHYQFLQTSTNPVSTDLQKQSLLMAAKAAFFRQGYNDARGYLNKLVDDPRFGPEAYFILGDIELEEDTSNKLSKFEEAIKPFQRVTNFYGRSRFAPLAMGKIANCHFQLAAQNTNRFEMATNQYWQVILSPLADVATRSQAEVGLGEVLVKMAEQRSNRIALLEAALKHYLDVVYGRHLRPDEHPDPFWISRAALAAGSLAVERLQRYDEAERFYREMFQLLPSLRSTWEKRLDNLTQTRNQSR
ncbi:MAG: tetratricopeptide repeat protein [Verrucomicrobiota bacterium]